MLHCLRSARGVPGAIFAGYVPLASLNPYTPPPPPPNSLLCGQL